MAKPKRKRAKKVVPVRVPGVTVYEALARPQSLPEDRLARAPTGKHRAHSEAGYGTGGGEWGFVHANRARPRPVRHDIDWDQARLLIEVEAWIKDCAEDVIHVVGQRQVRVFRASA